MKVSIIVVDYNYGRFVGAAIESALAQTWPETEVIVVDDGSTDDSPAVIARYAGRVTALRKENGGQASAFNFGFERSTGQLVIMLDADDLLYPARAARAVEHYREGVAKIQCRLDTIDRDGRDLNMTFPDYPPNLSAQKIKWRALSFGEYPCAPASGNVFSRAYLERVIPIPISFRYNADGYLNLCAPLHGDVETISEVLGAYRVHGDNSWAKRSVVGGSYATHIGYDLLLRQTFLAKAADRGYVIDERQLPFGKNHLENRLLSLRLTPKQHRVADDSRPKLVRMGIRSAWIAPDVNLFGRFLWSVWLVAVGFLPRVAVIALVSRFRLQHFRTPIARWLVPLSRKGAAPRVTAPEAAAPQRSTPVSIIIANYNYGRFLSAAIDSALAQDWKRLDVVVVDDGSTDNSRDIIARYGDRIKAIVQANGGQTSAFNAGFAASSGEVVIFLDADDRLHPNCVEAVMRAWKPGNAKLQYRLKTIDAEGRNLRMPFPYYSKRLRRDGLEARRQLLAVGSYPWPVASGNAFAREYLRKVMPLPAEFRRAPDGMLNRLAPLFGEVAALRDILADYRVHGANVFAQRELDAAKYAAQIKYEIERESFISRHAQALGYDLPETVLLRNKKHLETRLLSLRLSPARHPVPTDQPDALEGLGVRSAFRDPDLQFFGRLAWALWFVSLRSLPRRALAPLVRHARLQSGRHPLARAIVWLSRRW